MYYIIEQNGNRTYWPRSKITVNTKLIRAFLSTAILVVAITLAFSSSIIIPPFPTTNQRIANAQTTPAPTSHTTTVTTIAAPAAASTNKIFYLFTAEHQGSSMKSTCSSYFSYCYKQKL